MAVTELNDVEVLRAGTFTDMHGRVGEFSAADLAQIAKDHAELKYKSPIVLGHPKTDSPAYGWLDSVKLVGDRLVNSYKYVQDSVSKMVAEKQFPERSLKLGKNADGKWIIYHTGLLGATPPAVDGLAAIEFAAEDPEALDLVFEFAVAEKPLELGYEDNIMVSLWRNMRELLVRSNITQALIDQYLPMDMIDNLAMAVQATQTQEAVEDYKEAQEDEENDEAEDSGGMTMAAKPDYSDKILDAAIRLERCIADGRVLPSERTGFLSLAKSIAGQTFELASPDSKGKPETIDSLETTVKSWEARKPIVPMGKAVQPEDPANKAFAFAAPEGFSVNPEMADLYAQAKALQAKTPSLDILTAYKQVGGR